MSWWISISFSFYKYRKRKKNYFIRLSLGFKEIICIKYLFQCLAWVKQNDLTTTESIKWDQPSWDLLQKSNTTAVMSRVPGTNRFNKWNPLLLWVIAPQCYAILTSFSHRSFGACISTDITPPTYCRTLCLVSLILWTWLTARWSSHMMMFRWESPDKNKGDEDTGASLSF